MKDLSGQGSGEPAVGAFLIAPSDTNYLDIVPRAIYVGGSGNLAFLTFTGDVVMLVGVTVGSVLPLRAAKVFATGTTLAIGPGSYALTGMSVSLRATRTLPVSSASYVWIGMDVALIKSSVTSSHQLQTTDLMQLSKMGMGF